MLYIEAEIATEEEWSDTYRECGDDSDGDSGLDNGGEFGEDNSGD